ncbi:MAG: TonB-dependent receptor, partial [Verrucomicrobiota bacterium]|nr:TonB-dependent receptor [Verrucomicrobiota bacterium]
VPGTVDVITSDFINEINPTDLHDLLRHQAGVFTSGGKSLQDRAPGLFTLRGMGGSEAKLDGTLGFSGAMGLFMDPSAFERVEIVKGPVGSTVGGTANAMGDAQGAGGSVNLILKRPDLAREFRTVNARSSFGEDSERFRLGVDLNEPIVSDTFAVRLPANVEYGKPFWLPDGYRWRESFFLAPSALWHVRDDLRLGVNFTLQYLDQPAYQGIPTYRGKPIPGYTWDSDDATSSMRDTYMGFTAQPWVEWDAAEWLTLRTGAGYAFSDIEFDHLSNGGSYYNSRTGQINLVSPALTYEHSEGDSLARSYNVYERAIAKFDTGPFDHTFVVQGDYNRRITQGRQYFATVTSKEDVHNWVANNYSHTDLQKYGILAQDFVALWKFRLLGGTRFDYHESNLGNTAESLSPRGGVSFVATDWLIPFANISLTEAPNLGILSGPNREELTSSWRATQYEAGIRIAPVQTLWLTFSGYRIEQENLPVAGTDPVTGAATGFYDTEGENVSQGLELSLTGNITDNWSIYAAYAYNEYENKATGQTFDRFPPHSVTLSTSYRIERGPLSDCVAGAAYRYRHKYMTTIRGGYIGEDFYVDDSHVFDCSLDVPFSKFGGSKNVTASFGIKNIFGEKYIESNRHYYQCFPGEPRTFEIALRAAF